MKSLLKLHTLTLLGLAMAANAGLQTYLATGQLKAWAEINWMDVAGEGGSAVLALAWLIMLLHSRPAGRVTRLLALGLCCVFFSWWMDSLDEFIHLPEQAVWDNWLETAPMPIGLILLTLGIYHLNQEQRAISQQMSKREKGFREHRLFDKLTPLGAAEYLRQQVQLALAQAREHSQPLSLVAVDIDDFNAINQRYGQAEGDAVLQAMAQLLLLNLRRQDLLCRLAGDRFVAVLPNTGEAQARLIAAELQQAVASLAHRTEQHGERLHLQASTAAIMAIDENGQRLLPGHYGEVSHALTHAASLQQALELLQQFRALLSPLLTPRLLHDEKQLHLFWTDSCGTGEQRFLSEASLTAVVAMSRRLSGARLPWRFHLAYPQPRHIEQYWVHLGEDLTFDSQMTMMSLPIEYLHQPWPNASATAGRVALQASQAQLEQLGCTSSFIDQLYDHLHANIRSPLNLERVAQAFDMSPASLKRKLHKHGTGFQEQLDQVRKHVALYLYQMRGYSNEVVASYLCFNDTTNFRRSFKRWTGIAPSALRQLFD